ncbi:MAG: DUF421 domain-containing protein [Oscillospiraceae bacterium]
MLVVFIRAILLYIIIMFSLRLMGKRQLGELQPSEFVITILISNIASLPIEDTEIPMVLGAIPILVLVGFEIFVSNISLRFKGFRQFMSGKPMIIIHDGVIDQNHLKKIRFSLDDLMETLRQQKIFDIRDVEYAVVETTGKVSILEKFSSQTLTPKMLKLPGQTSKPPVVIISDRQVLLHSLQTYNLTEEWLNTTLKINNKQAKNIFLMTVDDKKNYYIVDKQ